MAESQRVDAGIHCTKDVEPALYASISFASTTKQLVCIDTNVCCPQDRIDAMLVPESDDLIEPIRDPKGGRIQGGRS